MKKLYFTIFILLTTFNLFCAKSGPQEGVYLLKNNDNHIAYKDIQDHLHRYRTLTSNVHVLYVLEVHKIKKWKQIDSDTMKTVWVYKAYYYREHWANDIINIKDWKKLKRYDLTIDNAKAKEFFDTIEKAYKENLNV